MSLSRIMSFGQGKVTEKQAGACLPVEKLRSPESFLVALLRGLEKSDRATSSIWQAR